MIGEDGLRSLLNRLPDGLVAVGADLTIIYANATAQRFFHPEQLRLGQPLPEGVFDTDLAALASSLFARDLGNLQQLAGARGALFRVTGIPSHDRPFVTLVFEDVTIRGNRERAQSEFVANAAHELLTPLTGIVSSAYALESGAKEVPELRDRFLEHISRECNRLTRIARGLLTLARAQSGEEPPRPEVVGLRELLDRIVGATADSAVTSLHCPTDVTVWVDPDLAETALANVIGNAARHSPDGQVDVSVDSALSAAEVGVVVASSARELSGVEVERVQRRFVSGGGRDGGGFGLGISIAAQAIEAVNGSLTFEAADGETRVRLTFPAGKR